MTVSASTSHTSAAAAATLHQVHSPIDGALLVQLALCGEAEIGRRIGELCTRTRAMRPAEALAFLERLGQALGQRRDDAIAATMRETGFIASDCQEMIDGAIEFLTTFRASVAEGEREPQRIQHSYAHPSAREMRIDWRPYRAVAVMVPQNASFTLALTAIAAGVYAGTRVIVRPSLQCGATAVLLAELLESCQVPNAPVLVVNCLSPDFLRACYAAESLDLLHYVGSNAHAESVLTGSFRARKSCLIDGQGNGMLYVDSSFPLDEAVELITSGATRYNGETCTSVNGVLVETALYPKLRERLTERFRALRVGDPAAAGTQIGPLFSAAQARRLSEALQGTRILCGGEVAQSYFTPALVESVDPSSSLVREGVFGPALWIQDVHDQEITRWMRANTFPLSDTILSHRSELVRAFAADSSAARITINADPSIESMFEPWGGYPPSGQNPVSLWTDKYRQAFQLDGPAPALPRRDFAH